MGWAENLHRRRLGTTNRRAWRLRTARSPRSSRPRRAFRREAGFPAAVAEIRQRLGDHPDADGRHDRLQPRLGRSAVRALPRRPRRHCRSLGRAEPGRTAIVPGLSSADPPDVMRGEEVQILGAVATGMIPADASSAIPAPTTNG